MRSLAGLALAALALHLVLILPNHPRALTPQALWLLPLELPVLLLVLLALPGNAKWTRLVRTLVVAALVAISMLKLADLAMFTAFGRSFNPVSDLGLAGAGYNLLSGAIGPAPAALSAALALAALSAVVWILWWATGRWAALSPTLSGRVSAGVAALLFSGLALAEIGNAMGAWRLPHPAPGAAFTTRVAYERMRLVAETRADVARFDAAAARDPLDGGRNLFDRLEGTNVEIVFVESYGRASFENPLYTETHQATLETMENELRAAGLSMRSGWLTSPIAGGQSWLAHATLASGLRIDGHTRYAALLASPRLTLFELATRAGYATAAVMPAITMPWPEAERLGFETSLDAAAMGYRGKPFNWVTMPDQFTLARYEALLGEDATPRFVQIALISSHAPWVPVPDAVAWDAVGDGTIFDAMATSGDAPDVVWRDRDRVRDQYRMAVDYSLRTVLDHARRRADRAPLMVVLGDHQPAGFVSQGDSRDVPVHLIGPPELVALAAGWNWTDGLVPSADVEPWPMETFRDRFVLAFSSDAGPSS